MTDFRNLDLETNDNALRTIECFRNIELLTAATANNKEYLSFFVGTVGGGSWTISPIDGTAAVSFTPTLNTWYRIHVSSITPPSGSTGFGVIRKRGTELVDKISTFSFTGTADTTNDILTVAAGDSATLSSESAVIPLIGESYNYEIVVSDYAATTTFTISYGGVTLYNKAGAGTFTGTIIATASTHFAIVIDTPVTTDIVITKISIQRTYAGNT